MKAHYNTIQNTMPREWVKIRKVTNSKEVSNTRRVERSLKLIAYLSEWRSFRQISEHLEIHPKSVFRYMDLLIQLGFEIEQKHQRRTFVRLSNVKQFFNVE